MCSQVGGSRHVGRRSPGGANSPTTSWTRSRVSPKSFSGSCSLGTAGPVSRLNRRSNGGWGEPLELLATRVMRLARRRSCRRRKPPRAPGHVGARLKQPFPKRLVENLPYSRCQRTADIRPRPGCRRSHAPLARPPTCRRERQPLPVSLDSGRRTTRHAGSRTCQRFR